MFTVGGTTSGYCAIGSFWRATRPMITMTIDRTVAKIGRSTKKRANIGPLLRRRLRGLGRGGRPRAHAHLLRGHRPARPHALDPVHDHPVAGRDALGHGAEPVLDRTELHRAVLNDILRVHDQDVLPVLVGADRAVGHEDAGPGLARGTRTRTNICGVRSRSGLGSTARMWIVPGDGSVWLSMKSM